ncbi:MAG TPA: Ldh family oxidoreductase [Burkholderiales bacterium]|jgi:(2R)-3-sulfolactate dehydrogenase (NADP+)|nr:Ldh family oxidoreductase [Burkholderiales bacterium]
MPILTINELTRLAAQGLEHAGASQAMADATARALVAAEAEGLATHGVTRVALYAQHLREGRANGGAQAKVVRDNGGACLIDAGGGLAFEAAALAVTEAVKRARDHGVAFSCVTNSHHFGAAAYHLMPAAQAGMAGLAFTVSPPAVNAWGGSKPLYGTNPIAAVFPRKDAEPIVIDLSITEVTRGKILLAAKENRPIPEGWALDKAGNPTTDAKTALTGSLFPIGGVKGTMLALIVELLCCALTGAAFSFENDSYFEPGNKPRIGHAIIVIDPGALAGRDSYFARIETLIQAMLEDEGVRLPGARRQRAAAQARQQGIEIPEALHRQLQELAASV